MTQDGNECKGQRIYICGPLSSDNEREQWANVAIAKRVSIELMEKGHYPFCPHLAVHYNSDRTYEQWLEYDLVWLKQCEAIFFIGESPGANKELANAKELGLQVFHELKEVPDLKGAKNNE